LTSKRAEFGGGGAVAAPDCVVSQPTMIKPMQARMRMQIIE
jgi:hypothetical protein